MMTRRLSVTAIRIPQPRQAFIMLIAGFIICVGVSIYGIHNSQAKVHSITSHRLSNMGLISHFTRDLNQEQLLVAAHIIENEQENMNHIEAELAGIEADSSATLDAVEPGDAEVQDAMRQLRTEFAALRSRIAEAITLSRQNRDAEAETLLKGLRPQFDQIDRSTDHLLLLNQTRADQEITRIHSLQLRAVILLVVLGLAWIVFAVLTAVWVTRLIGAHQARAREALQLLEERNRELDAFSGRVAHDLRSPLNTISLATAAFAQPKAETSTLTETLRRAVGKMDAIIEDLLQLSRVSGQISGATCQASSITSFTSEDLAPKVKAVGGLLQIQADKATVTCSEGLLRQVLLNLGENAVKYRRSDVALRLEIRGRMASHFYEITVADNGTGMSAEEVRHAFEPFFRGRQSRSTPGTGLGLSIVKRVIDASGGSLSLDSLPGRGTTFKIHLPLATRKAA